MGSVELSALITSRTWLATDQTKAKRANWLIITKLIQILHYLVAFGKAYSGLIL